VIVDVLVLAVHEGNKQVDAPVAPAVVDARGISPTDTFLLPDMGWSCLMYS